MIKDSIQDEFGRLYGRLPENIFFAPGRVNLIGEHTDYNGGHVLPCTLTIGIYAAAAKNGLNEIRLYSMNFRNVGVVAAGLDSIEKRSTNRWANFPLGAIKVLNDAGFKLNEGFDIVYYGNLPSASGLSSSAAMEVLTIFIANRLYNFGISGIDMAKYSQKAENDFVGMRCGIMDQFAIAMGKAANAIFLDTSDMEYEYVPLNLGTRKIIIACTNKKRGLVDSKYNERRAECEEALKRINKKIHADSLGKITLDEFEEVKGVIEDLTLIKRVRHVIYENWRTVHAAQCLKNDNLIEFGKLMNESNESLRVDYEVTGLELDALTDAAVKQPGVLGSRMTGAGFGGCTVNIVQDRYVTPFIEQVGAIYKDKIGYDADFYVITSAGGPGILEADEEF